MYLMAKELFIVAAEDRTERNVKISYLEKNKTSKEMLNLQNSIHNVSSKNFCMQEPRILNKNLTKATSKNLTTATSKNNSFSEIVLSQKNDCL